MNINHCSIPILMYHEISEQNNPWCVSLQQFEEQMLYLQQAGYKTISLLELKERMEITGGKEVTERIETKERVEINLAEKLIVLTFDDARKGVYEHAFPLLQRLGFKATVYVVPRWLEASVEIPFSENYSSFMNWAELKELSKSGWGIGSHSYSHCDLTTLDEEQLEQELLAAEKILEEKLGLKVKHFSSPFGKCNSLILQKINQRYLTGVGVKRGLDKLPGEFSRQLITRNMSWEIFKKLLLPPKLSLCLIVKNEEQFLEQGLNSVDGLADEVIIVDTGSTDQTKAVAQKFAEKTKTMVKIYDFPWCNDFSAARNESLKYATGDWILVLDADEVLAREGHFKIREALNCWETKGFSLLTRNYTNNTAVSGWQPVSEREQQNDFSQKIGKDLIEKDFSGWFPSLKVRLFQNHQGICFSGKMHELVESSPELQGKTVFLNVPVHHYGELRANSEEKRKNYLALTQQKLVVNPADAKAYFELGVQYKELGQFNLAEKAFQHCLKLDPQQVLPVLNLALIQQKQGKLAEAKENYQKVLLKKIVLQQSNVSGNISGNVSNDSVPKQILAEAYFGLGFCSFKENNLLEAENNFQQALVNKPNYVDAYINLGAIYEKQQKFREAVNILQLVLTISPQNSRAYYNLGVVWEKVLNLPEAIKCYQKAQEYNYGNYSKKEELGQRIEKMKKFWEEVKR